MYLYSFSDEERGVQERAGQGALGRTSKHLWKHTFLSTHHRLGDSAVYKPNIESYSVLSHMGHQEDEGICLKKKKKIKKKIYGWVKRTST